MTYNHFHETKKILLFPDIQVTRKIFARRVIHFRAKKTDLHNFKIYILTKLKKHWHIFVFISSLEYAFTYNSLFIWRIEKAKT